MRSITEVRSGMKRAESCPQHVGLWRHSWISRLPARVGSARVLGVMTALLARPLRAVVKTAAGRFMIDFWMSPRTAWRRYRVRRTWPTRDELEQMTQPDFEAHMHALGIWEVPEGGADISAGAGGVFGAVSVDEGEPLPRDPVGPGVRGGRNREGPETRAPSA